MRVLWKTRRLNWSVLKEINLEYSLEGLMLKHLYFSHLMGRAHSVEKILMLGKIEGSRRRERQRMRWLDSIIDSMDMSLSKLWEIVRDRKTSSRWGCKELDMTERLNSNSKPTGREGAFQ